MRTYAGEVATADKYNFLDRGHLELLKGELLHFSLLAQAYLQINAFRVGEIPEYDQATEKQGVGCQFSE